MQSPASVFWRFFHNFFIFETTARSERRFTATAGLDFARFCAEPRFKKSDRADVASARDFLLIINATVAGGFFNLGIKGERAEKNASA